jgi:hypothetical protein
MDLRRLMIFCALLGAFAVGVPAPAPADPGAPDPAPADSAQAALQAELDAMLRELHGDWGSEDPFEGGRPPDLLVVTTSDVRGEVAPCG